MRVLNKKHWPYQIQMPLDSKDPDDAVDTRLYWLKKNIDKDNWRFNGNHLTYCFANREDAIMFKLACW